MAGNLIKSIFRDLKGDFLFLKDLFLGKAEVKKYAWKEELRKVSITQVLKDNYIWYLLIILGFFAGKIYAENQCQSKCNEFIITKYIEPLEMKYGESYKMHFGINGELFSTHYGNDTRQSPQEQLGQRLNSTLSNESMLVDLSRYGMV